MVDETLLSSLCSICNITKSKYQCPACAARTCSLPCYKRHQQRALCTGKRDPTKYVKKSQLATPAGIDHDFNFITGIERQLEKSEKDVNDRGLGAPPEVRRGPRKGELNDHDLNVAGVKVVRAPKGLSRQRENKSRRSNKNRSIIWTVEWVREDKTRQLTECTSAEPILSIHPYPTNPKKRKILAKSLPTNKSIESQDVSTIRAIKVRRVDANLTTGHEEAEHSSPRRPAQASHPVSDNRSANSKGTNSDTEVAEALRPSLHIDGTDAESVPSEYNFFLLRPQTSSSCHVLIPLSAFATLGQCLRGRTVLEFPTIYAFPDTLTGVPEGFILEEEYMRQEGEEQKEFEDLLKHAHPEILRALNDTSDGGNEKGGDELDSRKILDVLKQDLGNLI